MTLTNRLERVFEQSLFRSRWLLAPFYVGLVFALAMLLYHFAVECLHTAEALPGLDEKAMVITTLKLIDLSLTANLLLIVIFAGYENFISRMDTVADSERSAWMGNVDFSGLKIKLLGSIVAISAIQLLETFLDINRADKTDVAWQIGIHLVFVVSGLMLALTDRLVGAGKH